MRTSVTLGFVALLAACGGSGTPTVVAPEIEIEPLEPEIEVEPLEPEPVIFEFDLGDNVIYTPTSETVTLGDVTYALSDFEELGGSSNDTFLRTEDQYIVIAQVVDGDSYAASVVADAGGAIQDLVNPENFDARTFGIQALGDVPVGEANFTGQYRGLLIQTAPVLNSENRVVFRTEGDATLTVDFAENLSDSMLSGSITNRELLNFEGGSINGSTALNDATIENGRLDVNGAFVADFVGGEQFSIIEGDTRGFEFETVDGAVSGQFGGASARTAVGVVRVQHYINDVLDVVQADRLELFEPGGFVATQD